MNVLIACEYSGIVRDAFIKHGINAISCDILPTESPGPHYQGNVFDIINNGWDLMIAHPPCTYLCNSGVRWLREKKGRWQKLKKGAEFFQLLLQANIKRIAIENPIQHKYASVWIKESYDQIIQPHQFGHGETKATCLWLKNLPKLKPTNHVLGRKQRIHNISPGKNRGKERSKFYPGIAEAMAIQWGLRYKIQKEMQTFKGAKI